MPFFLHFRRYKNPCNSKDYDGNNTSNIYKSHFFSLSGKKGFISWSIPLHDWGKGKKLSIAIRKTVLLDSNKAVSQLTWESFNLKISDSLTRRLLILQPCYSSLQENICTRIPHLATLWVLFCSAQALQTDPLCPSALQHLTNNTSHTWHSLFSVFSQGGHVGAVKCSLMVTLTWHFLDKTLWP